MKYTAAVVALAGGLLGLGAGDVSAQVAITPQIGAYIPGGSFQEVREGATNVERERQATMGLGLSVEMGWLRGSLAYATGAKIDESGVQDRQEIGKGSVLNAAADIVLRPLPRLLVQPYLLGGVGLKNTSYEINEGVTNAFPDGGTELAAHVGLGADLMLGGIGIVAEISDFISRDTSDKWGVHDAFAMVGLKLKL